MNTTKGGASGADGVAAGAVLAGVALLVYVVTLYPDVAGGDSGELAAAVATGGIIHPSGYPLFSLVGRVFAQIPHGTLAWRLNLMSAICDSAAAAVLCVAVTRRTRSSAGGVVAGALFAFAPGVWAFAICAEVFALNNLFVALLVLSAVLYDETRDRRHALWGAFVVGLGMSNHQSILFTALPLVLWMLWTGRDDLLRRRVFVQLVGLVCLGLLPYAILFHEGDVRSSVSWGAINSWKTFWWHVLRRDYGTLRLAARGASSGAAAGQTLAACLGDTVKQVGYWGLLPLAVGPIAIKARGGIGKGGLGGALCIPPALAVVVFVLFGNISMSEPIYRTVMARFWQQPEIYVFMSVGVALAYAEMIVGDRYGRIAARRIAALIVGNAILLTVVFRAPAMNRHDNTLVRSYGAEILRAAPPDALLLTRGDLITNVVRYIQVAEGKRPDVRIVDLELLGFAWAREQVTHLHPEIVVPEGRYMPGAVDGFDIRSFLDSNIQRAPIIVCGGFKKGDTSADAKYERSPFGVCEAVRLKGAPGGNVVPVEWLRESENALPRIDVARQDHPPGSWENIVYRHFLESMRARAMYAVELANGEPSRRWLVEWAVGVLQGLIAKYPDVPSHVYEDLAIAMAKLGLQTPEQRTRVVDALRTFIALGPEDNRQRLLVEKEIKRLGAFDRQ